MFRRVSGAALSRIEEEGVLLMSIHEHLPPQARKQLQEVGWTKGLELAKLARRDRQHFDCATWLHKARQMPKEDFKKEVEKELTGLGRSCISYCVTDHRKRRIGTDGNRQRTDRPNAGRV